MLFKTKKETWKEVLNGEDEQSKYVYISFLKLFQNFDFHTHICSDVYFSSNVFTQTIDFTVDSKNLEINPETEQFFEKVMKKIRAFIWKILKNIMKKI